MVYIALLVSRDGCTRAALCMHECVRARSSCVLTQTCLTSAIASVVAIVS